MFILRNMVGTNQNHYYLVEFHVGFTLVVTELDVFHFEKSHRKFIQFVYSLTINKLLKSKCKYIKYTHVKLRRQETKEIKLIYDYWVFKSTRTTKEYSPSVRTCLRVQRNNQYTM